MKKSAVDEFLNRQDVQNQLKAVQNVTNNMHAQGWDYGSIPVLENVPSGMGNDPRYTEVSPDYQAEKSRQARLNYQDKVTDPLANLDFSTMNDNERADAVAEQERLANMSTPERVANMSANQRQILADGLIDKEGEYTPEETDLAKALFKYYDKNDRTNDLAYNGAEGYQRAMRMQSLGTRTSGGSAFISGFVNAIPGADKLLKYVSGLEDRNEIPDVYETMRKSEEQNKTASGLGTASSKIAQYMTLAEIMEGIPVLNAAKTGISSGVEGGLNTLGTDLAMNTGGKLASVGGKLASGGAKAIGGAVGGITMDQLADTLLDVIPNAVDNANEGQSAGEVAKNIAKDEAINLGFNLGAEGLKQGFNALKGLKKGSEAVGEYDKLMKTLNGENAIKTNAEIEAEQLAEQQAKQQKYIDGYLTRLQNGTATKSDMDAIINDETLRNAVNDVYKDVGVNLKGIPAEDSEVLRRIKRGQLQNDFVENNDSLTDVGLLSLNEPKVATQDLRNWQGPFQKPSTKLDDLLKQTEGSEIPGFTDKELADIRAKETLAKTEHESEPVVDDFLESYGKDNATIDAVEKAQKKQNTIDKLNARREELVNQFSDAILKNDGSDDAILKQIQKIDTSIERLETISAPKVQKKNSITDTVDSVRQTVTGNSLSDQISTLYKEVNGDVDDISEIVSKDIASGNTEDARVMLNDIINDVGNATESQKAQAKNLLSQLGTDSNSIKTDEITLNSGDMNESKVFTNTLSKQRTVDMNNTADQINSMHDVHHKDDVVNTATKRVVDDYDKWDNYYRSEKGTIDSDADVVSAMQIIRDKQSQIDSLMKNGGSKADIDRLTAEKRVIQKKLRQAGTSSGQEIKAFQYWNSTPEGAIINTERLMDSNAAKWEKSNKGMAEKVNDMCATLTSDMSLPEIKGKVSSVLKKKYGNTFTDEDIAYISNLLNTGASKGEVANMVKCRIANGVWGVSEDTVKNVTSILEEANKLPVNSKARVDLEMNAFWELANSSGVNSSIADKLNSWRYLAMLGNPKTHVRNIVGNTLFQGVTGISNNIAAAMEGVTDYTSKKLGKGGIERTKAILTPSDHNLIKACNEDAITGNYRALSGGSKYKENIKDAIANQKEIFSSKAMRGINNANSKALDYEDFMAMRNKYKTSLAGYLKSNGVDESIFDAEKQLADLRNTSKTRLLSKDEQKLLNELSDKVSTLEKGREYATKQAEYSAFHEDNAVAEWLTKVSNNAPGPMKLMVEGVLPFKKTPANILKSGLEYSPLNILNDAYRIAQASKGNVGASEVIEGLSKTLTGTGLVGFGAYLYDKGILKSSDEDTKWQDSLEGIQNYSLKIGNKTYTIDFAAPSVMPLLLGAEIKKVYDSNNVGDKSSGRSFWDNLSDGLQVTSRLASPIMETSMLSGINDTLETLANGNTLDALTTLGVSTLTGYATQMIPTLMGQVARIIDDTRRSTYSDEGNSLARIFDKQATKIKNKVPFLSMESEPYVDVYARQQSNSPVDTGNKAVDTLINGFYQGFSPTYIQDINTTSVDAELRRLYEATKDSSVFFDLETSPKVDGERLSKENYTTYTTEKGENILSDLEKLFNSDIYKNLDDDHKLEMVKEYESIIKNKGKESIVDGFDMSTKNKYNKAYKEGGIDALAEAINTNFTKKAEKEAKANKISTEEVSSGEIPTEEVSEEDSNKVWLKENNISTSGKASKILEETGSQEQTLAYSEVSKVSTNKDSIAVLESSKYSNMSDYDKGYVLSEAMSQKAKKAQELVDNGDYADYYLYYSIKSKLDTSGNGKLDKKNGEKAKLIPYLQKQGYSQKEIDKITGWY